MRVLIHICCAPCASHCIFALQKLGHDVTLFFSNSNIAPRDEYQKRLDNVYLLLKKVNIPLLVDDYQHGDWINQAASGFEHEPEKGKRCARCIRYNLQRTHSVMLREKFDGFTTSLSVSPHKHTPTIFSVGREIDTERFLAINFKKDDGFKHSIELAKQWGLYRQDYCGCDYSIRL